MLIQLNGTISTAIGSLSNLRQLLITGTELTGTLPSEIGTLRELQYVTLGNNPKLGGTIPEELYDLSVERFSGLSVENCNFSGTISTRVGNLKSLKQLELANNRFSGTIPTEISAATGLREFSIQGNRDLTGTFPESVCSNSYQDVLGFDDVSADCLPDEDTGIPKMECECCNHCCSAQTGICRDV